MDKQLKQLKEEYHSIPIPNELDEIVNEALRMQPRKKHSYKTWALSFAAAAMLLFTASVNISPAFAQSLSDIPVIGKLVKIITFSEIEEETENNSSVNIKTPEIQGLENSSLANNLNAKYIEESKQLYAEYKKYMATLKEGENANIAIQSGYEVLTENDTILSIRRFTVINQASTSVENQFDTIDIENEVLITLKSLFTDESYVDIISEEIKNQMRQQMAEDKNNIYWLEDDQVEPFTQIKQDQSFYINSNGKLVIAFDKYEVAPGYMGAVEFIIPTEILKPILVGTRYIQ